VLHEIDAGALPQLLVFNKIDLLPDDQQPRQPLDHYELEPGRRIERLFVSARDGRGIAQLRSTIAQAAVASRLAGDEIPAEPDVRAILEP
jgi:GTP-binding protein HflX